jgi:hypothetical protein
MSTNNNSGQTYPNFTHRIDGDLSSSRDLVDIISGMTYRATGVLKLLAINQDNGSVVADHIASAAIHAAIAEIEDINVTIEAYHVAMVAAKNESKGGAN